MISTTSSATPGLPDMFFFALILIVVTYDISAPVEQVSRPAAKRRVYLILVSNVILNNAK
jgi:hypothetical protein